MVVERHVALHHRIKGIMAQLQHHIAHRLGRKPLPGGVKTHDVLVSSASAASSLGC
jgi:hypothetical protein